MVIQSENCPRKDACVWEGKGVVHMKELADKKSMYDHVRMFAHNTLDPGCSIGYHPHYNETEFYYILKGEGVFNDNGTEVILRAGDISATAHGEYHGLENRSDEPLEMIALIVLDN